MSNLHLWKTKGKRLASEYISCMPNQNIKDSGDYERMRKIQEEIGIKRC
jgi:hypothetical protein